MKKWRVRAIGQTSIDVVVEASSEADAVKTATEANRNGGSWFWQSLTEEVADESV